MHRRKTGTSLVEISVGMSEIDKQVDTQNKNLKIIIPGFMHLFITEVLEYKT